MIPTWVITALVVLVGCFLAIWIGSTLPEYGLLGGAVLLLMIACTLCAMTNNFPLLLAIGSWAPFAPPIPLLHNLPAFVVVESYIALLLFFRLCVVGSLSYMRSFNLYLLVAFSWVPIRFLMNPVHKLGAGVDGGSGVSGAMPYFQYLVAFATIVFVGAGLNSRPKIAKFLRYSLYAASTVGIFFLICAFIPSTGPYLVAMGSFNAGSMGDGIQRLVQLPGYGLFLVEASLFPAVFRIKGLAAIGLLLLGLAMIVIGGNRSALAAAFIAVPFVLFLRGKIYTLFVFTGIAALGLLLLHVAVADADNADISPLARSFGVFDSKIDEAAGGSASAKWRYAVWQSGIDKIMEHPIIGKGFGNLPQHLDSSKASESTDFEVILAGGEAHNGFVTSAYGFGIPFMCALALAIIYFFFRELISAFQTKREDQELRQTHIFLACQFAVYPLLIYTAFDLSVVLLWVYVGIAIILERLRLREKAGAAPGLETTPQAYSPHSYTPAPYSYR